MLGGRIVAKVVVVAATLAMSAGVAACGGKSSPNANTSTSAAATASSKSSAPITIGDTAEKTGPVPSLGLEANGVLAAANYLNAHGGVMGRQLKIVVEDNAGDPTQAVSQLRTFASQGVNIVLGGGFEVDCAAELPIAAADKQVVVCGGPLTLSPSATNMFAIGNTGQEDARNNVALAARYGKKVALFASNVTGSEADYKFFVGDAKADGLTPISERYPPTATSLKPEILDAMSKGAQVIWDSDCTPTDITAANEAVSLGYKGKFILESCIVGSPALQALKGIAGNQRFITNLPYSMLSTPGGSPTEQQAIAAYKSQVKGPPNLVVSAGWDLMMLTAKAIEAAHSTATPALLATLNNNFKSVGVYQGATYTSTDHNGVELGGYAEPMYVTPAGTLALLHQTGLPGQ